MTADAPTVIAGDELRVSLPAAVKRGTVVQSPKYRVLEIRTERDGTKTLLLEKAE